MEQIYITDGLKVNIEPEAVLDILDCDKNSPVYDEMMAEFQNIYDEVFALLKPSLILGFGEIGEACSTPEYIAGTRVIYAVLSVGGEISHFATKAFSEGDCVRGMLCDAMADCALFSLEDSLKAKLMEICKEHNIGISKRLEAPHDIPMSVQREAWETLCLKEKLGINITDGYMLDPVKTSCQVFVVCEDTKDFNVGHNCRNCSNENCKFRNIEPVQIKVKTDGETKTFFLKEKESLMDGLIREGYYISAVCAGRGICGKCKIQVLEGNASVSAADEKNFSEDEIKDGWRLSCTLYPEVDLTIAFNENSEDNFEVLSDYADNHILNNEGKGFEIAIDIGTTTIAFALLNESKIIHTVTSVNHQRKYGADVVSRINASVGGKKEELKSCIQNDLKNGILSLCNECGIGTEKITAVAIACNTTMSHLLMGYDCEGLGKYPFTPVNVDFIRGRMDEIIGICANAPVTILPGISTYVGGDIVSGLYECGFYETDEISLLVDLGTNGEMALGNRERILVTSTAAGPAFEGGNISCGVGSIEGAICSVSINGDDVKIKTIRDRAPVGICGTGVVELTRELLKAGLIDETGLLDEDWFDEGFAVLKTGDGKNITFTQKDIRELQLAKAAIRAGIETLIKKYGISKNQVSKVYIAGGFGYRLDIEKAIDIGMLPEEFISCTKAVGNSSLAGAIKYLGSKGTDKTLNELIEKADEVSLSTDKDFNDFYMDSMMF